MSNNIVKEIIKREKKIDNNNLPHKNEKLLSYNTKTGYSLNFPHLNTCQPSKVCKQICYGAMLNKPITWKPSIKKYLRNYNYFQQASVNEIVARLSKELNRIQPNMIRWNGTGDLFDKSIYVLNKLTWLHPDIKFWVVTRKVKAVKEIMNRPNIFIGFSIDKSSKDRMKQVIKNGGHPRLYFNYLRMDENDKVDDKNIKIIYNAKQFKELTLVDKQRSCPADDGTLEIKDACLKCGKCFNKKLFEQKEK